jgi:hypothetical protein
MNSSNQYQACIDACNVCVTACNSCIAECLKEDDVKSMAGCIELDIDCAAVCSLAASAMARNSELAKHFASYAAKYAWLVPMNAGNISTDIAKGALMPVAHVPQNVAQ